MKYILPIFLVLVATLPARADMYTALTDVYETNPEIIATRQAAEGAAADINLAKTGWQPAIGAQAGLARTHTKFSGTDYDENQKQIGVNITQNIFQGFSTTAGIKAAKAIHTAEQARLYATEQDVFLQAVNAYIRVLNAQEVLRLNQNNEKVLHEYYDLYVQKEKVGVLTKTDTAQAAARLEYAKYQVIDARAELDNAIETVRRIYGTEPSAYTDIDLGRLSAYFPASLQSAETQALKNHPSILAAEAHHTASREEITVAKQTYMPSVDIKASALKYDNIPVIDDITDTRIGLYLTVPLYDQGTAFARTRKAKATAAASGEQSIHVKRLVLEQLRQAWNKYQAQQAAIKSARLRIKAAKLALEGVRDEQERGRRTVLDVLNAEQEVLDAQVALTYAKHAGTAAYFAVLSGTGALTAEHLGLK
ncbi:MAG: TolC family outer membrane protein [Alphaproteobacteria bacterium]